MSDRDLVTHILNGTTQPGHLESPKPIPGQRIELTQVSAEHIAHLLKSGPKTFTAIASAFGLPFTALDPIMREAMGRNLVRKFRVDRIETNFMYEVIR